MEWNHPQLTCGTNQIYGLLCLTVCFCYFLAKATCGEGFTYISGAWFKLTSSPGDVESQKSQCSSLCPSSSLASVESEAQWNDLLDFLEGRWVALGLRYSVVIYCCPWVCLTQGLWKLPCAPLCWYRAMLCTFDLLRSRDHLQHFFLWFKWNMRTMDTFYGMCHPLHGVQGTY